MHFDTYNLKTNTEPYNNTQTQKRHANNVFAKNVFNVLLHSLQAACLTVKDFEKASVKCITCHNVSFPSQTCFTGCSYADLTSKVFLFVLHQISDMFLVWQKNNACWFDRYIHIVVLFTCGL